MVAPKVFFTSYSHSNRDQYLERFVKDLAAEVKPHLAATALEDVYFFDVDRLETGDYWRDKLARELVSSKTFVAICTPAFVSSAFCGKELQVFLERLTTWKNQPHGGGEPPESGPLFPIVWVASDMPKVFPDVQDAQGNFPEVYATKGLRVMYALRKYAEKRKEVVILLAERIANAAKVVNLPSGAAVPHFDYVTSAFEEEEKPMELGVALLPLLGTGLHGEVYPGGATLSALFQAASGAQVPTRVLEASDLVKRLRASRAAREAVVVVTDGETMARQIYGPLLAILNAELGTGTAVIVRRSVAVNAADDQQTEISVTTAFGDALERGAVLDWTAARSAAALETRLSGVILDLRKSLKARQAPTAAKDAQIAADASQDGVPIAAISTVSGPGSPGQ